jgi:hypothetical protein
MTLESGLRPTVTMKGRQAFETISSVDAITTVKDV